MSGDDAYQTRAFDPSGHLKRVQHFRLNLGDDGGVRAILRECIDEDMAEALIKDFEHEIDGYRLMEKGVPREPSVTERRASLRQIAKHASKLREALAALDSHTYSLIDLAYQDHQIEALGYNEALSDLTPEELESGANSAYVLTGSQPALDFRNRTLQGLGVWEMLCSSAEQLVEQRKVGHRKPDALRTSLYGDWRIGTWRTVKNRRFGATALSYGFWQFCCPRPASTFQKNVNSP